MHHESILPTLILLWCSFMSRTNSYDSTKAQLRRVKAWFRLNRPRTGSNSGSNPFDSVLLESFLLGLKKTNGGKPKRKRPITPEMLLAFCSVAEARATAEAYILLFAILIGFFCFLRKSNLTVETESLVDTTKMIRRADIRVDYSQYVLWVRIRRTKTIQSGDRELWIPIPGQPGHPLDIIALHTKVIAFYAHLPNEAHIFSGKWVKDSIGPLTYRTFLEGLKSMVASIGLDPTNVAGHSLRRGGASYAFHCGVPSEVIRAHGDWQSDCYLMYCVIPPSSLLAATRQMFEGIYAGRLGGEIWSASHLAK